MKRILFFLFFLLLILANQAFAFTDELVTAVEAMGENDASKYQKGLLVKHNDLVNQMRIHDIVSNEGYQASQDHYSEKIVEFAQEASKQHGATFEVQKRDAGKPWDAGTDSDFITNAKSAKQVKQIQATLNQKINDYIQSTEAGGDPTRNWLKTNDIDIMCDPANVASSKEFGKIAEANNDAYKRKDAAAYEAKSRSGLQPSVKETLAYLDEMREFIGDKKGKSLEYAVKLRQVNQHPDANTKGTHAYNRRMSMEAKLQQIQAQQSKYLTRIQDANTNLARHADTRAQDASAQPGKGKVRAPSETVTASKRKIMSASVEANREFLLSQGKMNEALMLSELAARNPKQAPSLEKRIVALSQDLSPSQKGELIERMQKNKRVPDGMAQKISHKMAGKTQILHKGGKVASFVGDYMAIRDELEKLNQGQHTFINIDKDDSEAEKLLKQTAVVMLELYPVPVISAMERGWKADERIQAEILEKIKKGEPVNIYMKTGELFWDITSDTVGSMTLRPVISGMDAVKEGAMTSHDMFKNWQDDDIRAGSQDLQGKKFDAAIVRMDKIHLGPVTGERRTPEGERLFSMNRVGLEDTLIFRTQENSTWTKDHLVRWEIKDANKNIIFKAPKVSATGPNAASFVTTSKDMKPGTYEVVFRLFDNQSNKQMDHSFLFFTISNALDIGPIVAVKEDGQPFTGDVKLDEKLDFHVKKYGTWDKNHTIEWFLDGNTPRKSEPADSPDIGRMGIRFDKYFDLGRHKVSVRAIDNKTQKIVAFQELSFDLVEKNQIKLQKMVVEALQESKTGKVAPLPLTVAGKDIIWMRARVAHPEQMDPLIKEPVLTFIAWRLYTDKGEFLGEKVEQLSETSGLHDRWMKPRIDKLKDGDYTLEVTHSLASNEKIKTRTDYSFSVVNPVKNIKLWVTHTKDDTKDRTPLKPGQVPHLYASFELAPGIESVETHLSAVHRDTGREIYSLARLYDRKKDKKTQKTGIRLGKKSVKPGDTVEFTASIRAGEGQPDEVRMTFTMDEYLLTLKADKTIKSGDFGRYQILIPKEFTPPFDISVRSRGLNIEGSSKKLTGFFSGTGQKMDTRHKIEASVTDSQGLSARGTAYVTIKAPAQTDKSQYASSNTNRPRDGEHHLYDKYGDIKYTYFYKNGKLQWRKHGKSSQVFFEPYRSGKGYVAIKEFIYSHGGLTGKRIKKQHNGKRSWSAWKGYKNGKLISNRTQFSAEDYPPEILYSRKGIKENEYYRDLDDTWLTGLSFSKEGKITSVAHYERVHNNKKNSSFPTEANTHWKFQYRYYYNEQGKRH